MLDRNGSVIGAPTMNYKRPNAGGAPVPPGSAAGGAGRGAAAGSAAAPSVLEARNQLLAMRTPAVAVRGGGARVATAPMLYPQ